MRDEFILMYKSNLKKILFSYIPFFVFITSSILFVIHSKRNDLISDLLAESFIFYTALFFFRRKAIVISMWVGYSLVGGLQMASLYTSGSLMIPLTLSNAQEFHALGLSLASKLFFIVIFFISVSFFILRRKNYVDSRDDKFFLLFFLVFPFTNGPFVNFARTAQAYYQQVTFSPAYNYPEISKNFLKVGVWSDKINEPVLREPNVIVIFTEGMSASVIDSVNHLGLGLTPNIDSLFNSSLVFDNYFNHTAATFRGLRGQLTSAYQFKDGIGANQDGFAEISNVAVKENYDNRLVSLPEILKMHGYKTLFLAATEKNSTLNTMIKSMSFDNVYGMGDFKFYQNDRMTDKQTFQSLQQLVEENKNERFFIGVYTSGTHHGLDSPDLQYKDGKNSYYNKFHNYDFQLGKFVEYLESSGVMKNTILIVTADHSTFPTPEFNSSFKTHAKYFVDKIPLIITGAGIERRIIDVKGVNSLSLTPTILHLLKINNTPNFFLGCSLFDAHCTSIYEKTSAIGQSFYKTESQSYPDYNTSESSTSKDILNFYNVSG